MAEATMTDGSGARWIGASVIAMLGGSLAQAVGPGVPSLGSAAADYVDYSVDSLPTHFTTGAVAAADNTPVDNPVTNAGAELGRVLFYDGRLSHNNGTSCASCHTQETGFADPDQFSTGFEGGLTGRHSMGLSNAKYYTNRTTGGGHFFWDERANTLEDQVLGPIQDSVEMGSNLTELVAELNATDFYPTLFNRAFGSSVVTSEGMSKALAQFVRSMASYQSPFDQAIEAGSSANPNFAAVASIDNPVRAAAGHAVFNQRCASCHRTDAQVADATHNIGLDLVDTDEGAGDGEFKVPSLRNIARRGRFMHDGRFQSLEEVIEFYSSGIQNNQNLSRGATAGGFNFTENQKANLLIFLETLTDDEFLMSELFSNPLVALAGDYDGSGVVDEADRDAWMAAFGMTDDDGSLAADGNGDGVVDAADYTLWRDNLGARWDDALSALAQAVPEPGTWLLAATGFCLLNSRPRRRQRPTNG